MIYKLKRELKLLDVFCIASGAMISSGLFVLPALAYAKAGPAVVFAYILAGILVLPSLFAKAELATAMPKAGGVYFFIERSMGAPVGTIGGLASWFSLSFKTAFALVGIGVFATLINPAITEPQIKLIAVGSCLFFMFVNIFGVKEAGRFQIGLVLALIGILVFYLVRGFLFIDPHRYVPFAPFGMSSIFATAGLVFVSFGGLTKICCVAEEVKDPGRNIPLGMFLAFIVVMFLYAAVIFVTIGLVDSDQLSKTLTPISLGASSFLGSFGGIALAIAALLAFVSTANAGILTASRDSMAMSRDKLLPKIFQRINVKYKTPHLSIIFTTIFMIVVILFLSLENLVKTASTLKILLFIFVNLSLIVMRESKIQSYRPKFRSPLYPWIQIAGIIGYIFLIFKMGKTPLLITGAFIICGFTWYMVYARSKVKRQAALMHVIERLTARELVNKTLPDELRDIIIERDEIVEDRFDSLINECAILDLEGSVGMEDFFGKVADSLANSIGVGKNKIVQLLMEREKESSTVIRPGLAIPHIVVETKSKFTILLARCKEGIVFPESDSKVHVVFILAGSKDERNFHLRALAAIAEISQSRDFDEKWLNARDAEELRHIILLAERKRFLGR
ncbi:MAG: amino acid permease [Candidatus Omnitrophica bacterium]|nr:amino acid permease [Candidatus Omnitrophota bacterium]